MANFGLDSAAVGWPLCRHEILEHGTAKANNAKAASSDEVCCISICKTLTAAPDEGLHAGYYARHQAEPDRIPKMSRTDFVFVNGNGMSGP